MSNNDHWHIDFGFTGLHTTFHHQCFQMVDLIMVHCKSIMNGLNPHTFPCEPEGRHNKTSSEANEERKALVEEWITPNHARMENHKKHVIKTKKRRT